MTRKIPSVFEPTPEGSCGIDRDMICTCSPEGERSAVALRLEVQQRLGVTSTDAWTAATLSLAWHFDCDIVVMSDQWFGVSARASDGSHAYIECDWPFDGVFALWKKASDRSPERLTSIGSMPDVSKTQAQAEALLTEYEKLEGISLAHDYACPACAAGHVDRVSIEPRRKRCEEGKTLWDAYFPPRHALVNLWAVPSYDDAPYAWGSNEA